MPIALDSAEIIIGKRTDNDIAADLIIAANLDGREPSPATNIGRQADRPPAVDKTDLLVKHSIAASAGQVATCPIVYRCSEGSLNRQTQVGGHCGASD